MRPNASTVAEVGLLAAATTPISCSKGATKHQIKINKDSANSGSIALTVKSAGATVEEIIYDEFGAAIVFNAASSTAKTYIIEGSFDFLYLTPTGLNGTYKYSYSAW